MEQDTLLSFLQSMVLLQSLVFSCVDRKSFPFTRTQFFIFTVLSLKDEVTMKHIAQYISSSQEQATRAVAPLVDEGYAERYIDPKNRTHVHIRLTEKGRAFLAEQRVLVSEKLLTKISASLSAEEIDALHSASLSMNQLLSEVDRH